MTPARFVALLEEFRHKLAQERINARLTEVKQEELIALIKLHAELQARYLVTVLDFTDPNLVDLSGRVGEARQYRQMAEEIAKGIKAVVDGIVAKEIPMNGLDYGPEFSPEMERAIDDFIAKNSDEWDSPA
jgi:hypothetical protein